MCFHLGFGQVYVLEGYYVHVCTPFMILTGRIDLISQCKSLPEDFCSELLIELVSRSKCKSKHLELVVCEMWSLKQVDASRISLQKLLVKMKVTKLQLIQHLMELGMQVSRSDISTAIRVLKEGHLYTFKHIASKCSTKDLDRLCLEASNLKKMSFVLCFVEQGAKPPGTGMDLFYYALKVENFIAAMDLVRNFPKATVSTMDLAELLATKLTHSSKLISVLIDAGVNPSGSTRKSPVSTIVASQSLEADRQVEILCLLLAKGVDCYHLCRGKKSSTTPLHVATEISLQAGM